MREALIITLHKLIIFTKFRDFIICIIVLCWSDNLAEISRSRMAADSIYLCVLPILLDCQLLGKKTVWLEVVIKFADLIYLTSSNSINVSFNFLGIIRLVCLAWNFKYQLWLSAVQIYWWFYFTKEEGCHSNLEYAYWIFK